MLLKKIKILKFYKFPSFFFLQRNNWIKVWVLKKDFMKKDFSFPKKTLKICVSIKIVLINKYLKYKSIELSSFVFPFLI
jgi:hypothetical protein